MTHPRSALVVAVAAALLLAAVLIARQRPPSEIPPPGEAPARVPSTDTATAVAAAGASSAVDAGPAAEAGSTDGGAVSAPPGCPGNMVFVHGTYCPFVAHRCERYLGAQPAPGGKARGGKARGHGSARRCGRYRNELLCEGRPRTLHYCIDRYEYPDLIGAKPVVMVDYRQAEHACAEDGKRLCQADEWAFACEGPRSWPYPYGIERKPGACNVDRRLRTPDRRALGSPWQVSVEIERLDQRTAAGARPACISPFGMLDATGNVLEWVRNSRDAAAAEQHQAAAAGGHFGRNPATCRSLEVSLSEAQRSHLLGFRCCRDTLDGQPARRMAPAGVRLPRHRRMIE